MMCVQVRSSVISSTSSPMCAETAPPPKSCLRIQTQAESMRSCVFSFSVHHCEESSKIGLESIRRQSGPARTTMNRKCSFTNVEVRPYIRCLGDNPSVTSGPPLSLSWHHYKSQHCSVDEYEAMKPPSRPTRAKRLDAVTRDQMLRIAGYSRKEILVTERNISDVRKSRQMSANQPAAMQKIEEGKASFHRKLSRWIKRKPGDNELYEEWVKALQDEKLEKESSEKQKLKTPERTFTIEEKNHPGVRSLPKIPIDTTVIQQSLVAGRTA